MGIVKAVDSKGGAFTLEARAGNLFKIMVGAETSFSVLQNIDGLDQDRFPTTKNFTGSTSDKMSKYIQPDQLISVYCIMMLNGDQQQFDARNIYLLQDGRGSFVFEHPQWWLRQISSFADTWLENLFQDAQVFDFSKYRTHVNITGSPIQSDSSQECATLSRLLYGLSSTYLMTGNKRYLDAATAGVQYLRNNFRYLAHDGESVMWASAREHEKLIIASQNGDDSGAIPLYEQIYALAGIAQYYRITQSAEALEDIKLTVDGFNKYYYDKEYKGYFSHLDPVTFTADTDYLNKNKLKKNWNSIGDHIPAYLVNIILGLEPLPQCEDQEKYKSILDTLKSMLYECTELIVDKFQDPDPSIPYVNERFYQDWTFDQTYSWQQNRAVCGHNLKIAWNLTRVANYYDTIGKDSQPLTKMAKRLADQLAVLGIDQIRGGLFDTVERVPKNGMWMDFAWMNTKDFWQQEQAILGYLITYDYFKDDNYLALAREMQAFWNLYYLDHDRGGFFFRVTDNGLPIINGDYADKGTHSISGYHAFELNYLTHVYSSQFVSGRPISMNFKPEKNSISSINVLPDFLPPKSLKITKVTINGIDKAINNPFEYQIHLEEEEKGADVIVELTPVVQSAANKVQNGVADYTEQVLHPKIKSEIKSYIIKDYPDTIGNPKKGKIAVMIENHYDATELERFSSFFPNNGYQVDFVSHLWNTPSITFYSNPTDDGIVENKITVTKEINDIDPNDYVALILIGAYATDRLRYEDKVALGKRNDSPALQFLRKTIDTNCVKIGTICHSLWLYCADSSLLKGKKVTCAHNIICDVENAGGLVQYTEDGDTATTVVDGNLVSGKHPAVIEAFMNKLLQEIEKQS